MTIAVQPLGSTQDDGFIVVTIALKTIPGQHKTIRHGSVRDPIRLSISGDYYFRGNRDNPVSCGQIPNSLSLITTPAPGWTLEEIEDLRLVWQRWHLNDMRAGCAHMDLPDDTSYDARQHIVCAKTNYKYGAEWLVEPMPPGVRDMVTKFMQKR